MNLKEMKERYRPIAPEIALAAVLAVLGLWGLVTAAGGAWSGRAIDGLAVRLEKAVPQPTAPKPEGEGGDAAKPAGASLDWSAVDAEGNRVKDRSIFYPIPPKTFGATLIGVMGDEAIFSNNKTGRVGADIDGAKITAVGPNWVEIEFDGKPQRLQVFDGSGPGSDGGSSGGNAVQQPPTPGAVAAAPGEVRSDPPSDADRAVMMERRREMRERFMRERGGEGRGERGPGRNRDNNDSQGDAE